MDTKSLALLELPKVLERLSVFASFSAGIDLCRALRPTDDVETARLWQETTTEARKLLNVKTDVTLGGSRDVRAAAGLAARRGTLDPTTLLDLKNTLIAARTLKRNLARQETVFPRLTAISLRLVEIPGLIEQISRTIDERGEVLDSASPKLGDLRRQIKVAHDRLLSRLDRLVNDPRLSTYLQEAIITQRDGRYVVPVKADFKGRLRGVVHDQSASGATYFVEPLATVELNNELRELRLSEAEEIRRILAELSAIVGEQSDAIIATVDALAELDLAFARAKYADATRAHAPILHAPSSGLDAFPTLRLLRARHPLLDPATVVAIDVDFGEQTRALVITGPNTGGKTVSLKTVGLLVLMAQCGLHLPAASGSELTVFRNVFADIGDEQSIEQSLSTFSAHITNITRILQGVDESALVIFDELGSGTDPGEGSALARAILSYLLDLGAAAMIATHYPELKGYANSRPGVKNASVEFDPQTLAPTYHLTIGLPGRSNAFAIAGRLGLNPTIIADARTMVGQADLHAEALLEELFQQREVVSRERERLEGLREAAEEREAALEKRLDKIEVERRKILDQARADARRELAEIREEAERLRRRLEKAESASAAEQTTREVEHVIDAAERAAEPVSVPPAPLAPPRTPSGKTRAVKLGDTVKLRSLNTIGTVTALSASEAEVKVGRLRVRAKLEEIELRAETAEGSAQAGEVDPELRSSGRSQRAAPVVSMEIDIRGKTVEEALPELEAYIDEAYLAELPFARIIHGKGTGKLRQAVREMLRSNPQIRSQASGTEEEGGDGVTVVRFTH